MQNNKFRNKIILNKYSHLSDEKFLLTLQEELTNYIILTKSEQEAKQILEKYDIEEDFSFNQYRKNKYYKMFECANLRNIVIPAEWFLKEITDKDIIERLNESRINQCEWIDNHSNYFDGKYQDELIDSEYVDDVINNIYYLYNSIIDIEFTSKKLKRLLRKKDNY